MSTRKLVISITFLAIFTMAARISVDTDTWWHLRAGQWMVENRSLLTTDPFSYTRAGAPWLYPGWVIEIPMYLIYKYLGPGGLNLWTALIVTLSFYFIWQTLSGGPFLRAFILILAATASGVYWSARPHLITLLFTAVFINLLERYRKSDHILNKLKQNQYLIWLPLVLFVWVNAHGGFLVGFLIWGVYWINGFVKSVWENYKVKSTLVDLATLSYPLSWIGVAMFIAACINPAGPSMLLYPFKTVGIGVLQEYIQEWQSPDFHSLQVQPFAWLILFTLGIVGVSKRRLLFTDFILFSGFAYMGLLAGRNIALFALVAPIVLSRHLDPLMATLRRRFRVNFNINRPIPTIYKRLNNLVFGVLFIAAVIKTSLIFPVSINDQAFVSSLPVYAVNYIKQTNPPGNLFNSYNWGGYLLWSLPDYPVFVDGRTDLYDDEIISQWLQVVRAEGDWMGVLEKWQVNLILLEDDLPVVDKLVSSGWKEVFNDGKSAIFTR